VALADDARCRSGHLSLFHYMALAPAQDPNPTTVAITTLVALILGGIATFWFRSRDIH
jgi:hypothetical protein